MISIHALLAESDLRVLDGSKSSIEISIHALLAESDTWQRGSRVTYVISIHALLAESDRNGLRLLSVLLLFLSTLSLRRATTVETYQGGTHHISIHALLAESDVLQS